MSLCEQPSGSILCDAGSWRPPLASTSLRLLTARPTWVARSTRRSPLLPGRSIRVLMRLNVTLVSQIETN
jgi:hypothetical protein